MARLQVASLLCLMMLVGANATGYYYGGHRRLTGLEDFAGRRNMLTTGGYYYGGHRRLSSDEAAPTFVRPLFGNTFMPAASGSAAADIPVPQFLSRELQGAGRQLTTYYYGSHRRLQSVGGRQLTTYYYGGAAHHRRLQSIGRTLTTYYYGAHH